MRVVLIRHAEAADQPPAPHEDDHERRLTDRGRRVHARMSSALARMEPQVMRILTSPLARARETAEITAVALGKPGVFPCESLGDRFSRRGLLDELRQLPEDGVVVLVGHAPTLGELAARLLHRGGDVAIEFKKSAILCLDFEGHPAEGGATLRWFLTPRALPDPPSHDGGS